jgi:hypothetical protein
MDMVSGICIAILVALMCVIIAILLYLCFKGRKYTAQYKLTGLSWFCQICKVSNKVYVIRDTRADDSILWNGVHRSRDDIRCRQCDNTVSECRKTDLWRMLNE